MTLRPASVLCLALLAACKAEAPSGWSGYVEGDYVYMAAPSAGTLRSLDVQRGASVARGAPLFSLDAALELAASAEADARLASARALAADADKGKRSDELAVVQAQLAQALSQARLAATELGRLRQLVAQGFLSASRLDDAAAAARQGDARVRELEAALRVAELPARADARGAAAATAQAAAAALQQAREREQQMQRRAPGDAVVADTFYSVGEWVPTGQAVLALLPVGATHARFYVGEREVGSLALGQGVRIACDGCGEPIAARIDFIATAPEYTPPVLYSNTQRARLVFRVEARPAPADGARLKPGQPVDVRRSSS